MGVAVTRKPTSTPGDHVKHPERLGVRRHDAGEAIAAMVTGRSWGVGVCCVLLAALHPSMRCDQGRRDGSDVRDSPHRIFSFSQPTPTSRTWPSFLVLLYSIA